VVEFGVQDSRFRVYNFGIWVGQRWRAVMPVSEIASSAAEK